MNWELLSSIKLEMEGWKDGRGQDGKIGGVEEWKMDEWKIGRMEGWEKF